MYLYSGLDTSETTRTSSPIGSLASGIVSTSIQVSLSLKEWKTSDEVYVL